MNKIKMITFGLIASFAFISIASATVYSSVRVELFKKGDYDEKVNALKEGNDRLTVDVSSKNDAILGLSLSKKGLFGYSFISRCNLSIENTTSVSCTWKNQSSGTYKGTAVLDTVGNNFHDMVDGYMYLSDKV